MLGEHLLEDAGQHEDARRESRVSTDLGNPGYPGKTLEFKRILEFLEKPWNSVENPGKITFKVDICQHLSIFCGLGRQDL